MILTNSPPLCFGTKKGGIYFLEPMAQLTVTDGTVQMEVSMLKFDGYDEAIVGKTEIWVPNRGGAVLVEKLIYDGQEIVEVLMKRDGMSEEEAREFVSFNVEGAYLGQETPIIYWPYLEL